MSEGIEIKNYVSYDDYIKHQKSKADYGTLLREKLLGEFWEPNCAGFRLNFKPYEEILSTCKNALCIGARVGEEVFVLRELGLDAIGIDLVDNPPLVIKGDCHDLSFEGENCDFIFSNIFDHVLYPDKFISEIERVVKPGGYCLLHLSVNVRDDAHAANVLLNSDYVVSLFKKNITVLENQKLNQPEWPEYWTLLIKFNE